MLCSSHLLWQIQGGSLEASDERSRLESRKGAHRPAQRGDAQGRQEGARDAGARARRAQARAGRSPRRGRPGEPQALERAQRRGDRRRQQYTQDYRARAPGGEPARGHAGGVGADAEAVAVGQRLGRHERGEQGGCQQHHDAREPGGQLAAAQHQGTRRLDREGHQSASGDHRCSGAHRASPSVSWRWSTASRAPRVSPASAAKLATSTGTPAGANGTSTSAISAPAAATPLARPLRASFSSSARKKAGKSASSPRSSGSPRTPPQSAPIAVPVTQVTYAAAEEPNRSIRSKLPSGRAASAHEASTTA